MLRRYANPLSAALLAALTVLVPAGTTTLAPAFAVAQTGLPAPYVSRALDAVLLPVDGSVIAAFGLPGDSTGVLVLATQPGGLAESAGILPGDIIGSVGKKKIAKPIELDEVVYYWILQGMYDFAFGGSRAGAALTTTTVITLEYWEEVIEITEITTWSSYSYESFSYEEFYAEYSEEISVSYEESLTTIEETVTSESYAEEVSEETTAESAEEATDEAAVDEAAAEEDLATEDEAADCPGEIVDGVCVEAEEAEAEDVADDGADEGADEGGDDGGDEGGDEEIVE